jgi:hypothetical protein
MTREDMYQAISRAREGIEHLRETALALERDIVQLWEAIDDEVNPKK